MELGHSVAGIQKLCIELATVIHANYHVAATVPLKKCPALYVDFEDHFEDALSTKSIELAVNFRLLLDRASGYLTDEAMSLATECLTIHEGNGKKSLRECANKLIHADHLTFSYGHYASNFVGVEPFRNPVKESSVELNGFFGGKKWRCTIDLLKFSEEAYERSADLRESLAGLIR